MMETKVWWQSKTLWINMAIAAAGVLLDAAPEGVEWVAFANMALRFVTTRGLSAS